MDTTQLLKGVLHLAVLAVVDREDGYGYDVVRRLRAGGLDGVGDASVYGTLRRLYAAGALTSYVVPSDEGPHRKYYGITPTGRTLLAGQRADWAEFSRTVSALLGAPPAPGPEPEIAPTQPLAQPHAQPTHPGGTR
jgi:PadR family transcriptional regulator, regulatory protein PadR